MKDTRMTFYGATPEHDIYVLWLAEYQHNQELASEYAYFQGRTGPTKNLELARQYRPSEIESSNYPVARTPAELIDAAVQASVEAVFVPKDNIQHIFAGYSQTVSNPFI
jgi:hypothetical protein